MFDPWVGRLPRGVQGQPRSRTRTGLKWLSTHVDDIYSKPIVDEKATEFWGTVTSWNSCILGPDK